MGTNKTISGRIVTFPASGALHPLFNYNLLPHTETISSDIVAPVAMSETGTGNAGPKRELIKRSYVHGARLVPIRFEVALEAPEWFSKSVSGNLYVVI